MKTFTVTLLIICSVIIAGSVVSWDYQIRPPTPRAMTMPHPREGEPAEHISAEPISVPAPRRIAAPKPKATAQAGVSSPPIPQVAPADSVSPIHQLVEALIWAKSKSDKQAVFDELSKNGQLQAAVADLKQMAAANPNDAHIPTTIGEAELNEIRAISQNGGTAGYDQSGILAMEADQEFNAALQIDPKNWEAQYVKASAMYYWPASPQFNSQLVQNLTGLIDQQDTMTPNPDYAQTYVLLGNEYQKIGEPDKAVATWQLGAQEYPNDPTLLKKLAAAAGQ